MFLLPWDYLAVSQHVFYLYGDIGLDNYAIHGVRYLLKTVFKNNNNSKIASVCLCWQREANLRGITHHFITYVNEGKLVLNVCVIKRAAV